MYSTRTVPGKASVYGFRDFNLGQDDIVKTRSREMVSRRLGRCPKGSSY
jgi:hypothetical protein